MSYSGAKGTMTPNNRLERPVAGAPPLNRNGYVVYELDK